MLDVREISRRIQDLSARYDLRVDPQTMVSQLAVGEQQKVEILKLLLSDARLLILDEPTRVLAPHEVKALFEILDSLRKDGYAVASFPSGEEGLRHLRARGADLLVGLGGRIGGEDRVGRVDLGTTLAAQRVVIDTHRLCGLTATGSNPVKCGVCGGTVFETISREMVDRIAALEGALTEDVVERGELPGVRVDVVMLDEQVQRVDPRRLVRAHRKRGARVVAALCGVPSA